MASQRTDRHNKYLQIKVGTETSCHQCCAHTVKRGTKTVAIVCSFALQRVYVQAQWCFFVRLAPGNVCDGYLVVVVFVEVVKELFCKTAKEDRTEEALETRFVLLHQTVTVDVQAVKDNLQGIDNLHIVELLD